MQLIRHAVLAAMMAALAACQSKTPVVDTSGKSAALQLMEQVATAAHKCWFASKDPAFKSYRFANELNSMSGQPRFLLVPARNYGGLPALVVQAQGPKPDLQAFGPLIEAPVGARIQDDLRRWAAGSSSCTATA
jgi:hypothetical protein